MADNKDPKNDVNEARRRLLRMAVYVPPVVIGSIALSQAGCQPDPCPSCQPFGGTANCRVAPPTPSTPEVETAPLPTESEF
jgi:hypothetical protein